MPLMKVILGWLFIGVAYIGVTVILPLDRGGSLGDVLITNGIMLMGIGGIVLFILLIAWCFDDWW